MHGVGRPRIGELLVEARVISQAQLEEALRSPRTEGQKIGQFLVEQGIVTEAQLTQTLSLQLSVPWVSLYHIDFSRQLLSLVPRDVAERFCAIPIFLRTEKKKQSTLYVAMDDPTNEAALAEIATAASVPVKPMIASPSDIRSAIRVYYAEDGDPPAPATSRERTSGTMAVAAPPPPPPLAASPPAAPPARPPPPPPTGRAPLATVVDAMEILGNDALAGTKDSPDAAPDLEVSDYVVRPRQASGPRMVALTLLDGTTLNLPARSSSVPPKREGSSPAVGLSEQLTARDLVSALRAVAHGADASEILGQTDWEAMFAALLSLLLKKNLIADWEFVEELRNI
jgi:type IV pilus assembly protein PilB